MHTTDPVKVIEHLHENLKLGGLLFFTARFKGNYNLALKYNERYEGKFNDIIQKIGFSILLKDHMWGPKTEEGKYLYVYQKS